MLTLSIVPIANLVGKEITMKNIKNLYSTDVIESLFNRVMVPWGISTNPEQVVVGDDRWLFLGDKYVNTRTMSRKAGDNKDIIIASEAITSAQTAWRVWMKENGVTDYRLLIGPNKGTVYSEFVPNWAKPSSISITDTLYAKDVNSVYVDVRQRLKQAKQSFRTYYRTDTHWNDYGAGIAHQEFFKSIAKNDKQLIPLDPSVYAQISKSDRSGGDLASFLKLENSEQEETAITAIAAQKIEHLIYDFNKSTLVYQGNNAFFGSMNDLYLIDTPTAVNDRKVLWLSDSFGTAQSQYMTASFSQVLKVHWGEMVGKEKLRALVKRWKPDYVFVTVVEREAFSATFKVYPPLTPATEIKPVTETVVLEPVKLHQVEAQGASYAVKGNDPFLIYDFKEPVKGRDIPVLTFSIKCLKPIISIPVQIFWRSTKQDFSAENNIRFNAIQGINQIQVPHWLNQQNLTGIRIDLDGEVNCRDFTQEHVTLGHFQ
jgi:hypothetical protein